MGLQQQFKIALIWSVLRAEGIEDKVGKGSGVSFPVKQGQQLVQLIARLQYNVDVNWKGFNY